MLCKQQPTKYSLDEFVDVLHSILVVLSAYFLAVDGEELRLLTCYHLDSQHNYYLEHPSVEPTLQR